LFFYLFDRLSERSAAKKEKPGRTDTPPKPAQPLEDA